MNMRKLLSAVSLSLAVLLAVSCNISLTTEDESRDAVIRISSVSGSTLERTAVPTALSSDFSYAIDMARVEEERVGKDEYDYVSKSWDSYADMTADTLTIAIGHWNMTLTASNAVTTLKAELSEREIKGGTNYITFTLSPSEGNQGELSYVLSFTTDTSSSETTTYTAEAILQKLGGSDIPETKQIYNAEDISGGSGEYYLTYDKDLIASGYYVLKITITATTTSGTEIEQTETTYTELVQIAAGCVTEKTDTIQLNALEAVTLSYTDDESDFLVINKNTRTALPTANMIPVSVTGYSFDGWYTDSARTQEAVKEGGIYYIDDNHQTYYLKWAKNTYSIVFDKNTQAGESDPEVRSGDVSNTTVTFDAVYPAMPVLYNTEKYTFAGWYITVTDGEGNPQNVPIETGTKVNASTLADLTAGAANILKAKWINVEMDNGANINSRMQAKDGFLSATKFKPAASVPATVLSTDIVYLNPTDEAVYFGKKVQAWYSSDDTTIYYFVDGITSLDDADNPKYRISLNEDCTNMFYGMVALEEIDLRYFDANKVNTMDSMFDDCEALTIIDGLSSFSTLSLVSMQSTFRDCYALTEIDLSNFNTATVNKMNELFSGDVALQVVDISGFTIEELTNCSKMFEDCSALTTIYSASSTDWNASSKLISTNNMFKECISLIGGNGTQYSAVAVSDPTNCKLKNYARVDDLGGTPGYFTAKP